MDEALQVEKRQPGQQRLLFGGVCLRALVIGSSFILTTACITPPSSSGATVSLPLPSPSSPSSSGSQSSSGGGMPSGGMPSSGGASGGAGMPSGGASGGGMPSGGASGGGGMPSGGMPGSPGGSAGADGSGSSSGVFGGSEGGGEGGGDAELEASLEVFEGELEQEMAVLDGEVFEETGGGPGLEPADDGEGGSAGDGNQGITDSGIVLVNDTSEIPEGDGSATGTQQSQSESQSSQNAGGLSSSADSRDLARTPEDVGDGSDDDIVAQQIREAAIAENDPALREKLWEEYRNYKKSVR